MRLAVGDQDGAGDTFRRNVGQRGVQAGDVVRIPNQGMPNLRGGGRVGDLLVQVLIEVPKKLSKEEQVLLRQLAELEHKHVAPERKGFFEKLKDYFTAETSDDDKQQ